jgi:hypothetical protein
MGLARERDVYLSDVLNLDLFSLVQGLERISTTHRGSELASRINNFKRFIEELPTFIETDDLEAFRSRVTQWVDRAGSMLGDIDAALRELRWQTSVGASTP